MFVKQCRVKPSTHIKLSSAKGAYAYHFKTGVVVFYPKGELVPEDTAEKIIKLMMTDVTIDDTLCVDYVRYDLEYVFVPREKGMRMPSDKLMGLFIARIYVEQELEKRT